MVDVHTVGAGGGSIGWADPGGALRVGPRSAGARPGPACYGHGGTEPTVTDANLLLGYLGGGSALAGGVSLDADAAERAVASLGRTLGMSSEDTAWGILRVADEEMVRALRVVTVERGIDPRRHALVAFGGAGPMHALRIAEQLGIQRVLCPRGAGVLSALGLVVAERRRDVERTVLLGEAELAAGQGISEAAAVAEAALAELPGARLEARYDLRYRGQSHELSVAAPVDAPGGVLRELFEREHLARYGYREPEGELELVNIRVAALESRGQVTEQGAAPAEPQQQDTRRARFGGGWCDTRGAQGRAAPGPGGRGPRRLRASRGDRRRAARMAGRRRRRRNARAGGAVSPGVDPVTLQVLAGALRAVCEEMGAALVRAAHSANIKERRDASTALFDAAGEMVMQAEHIPVHLGAMPDAVAAVSELEQSEGDAWILNDPYRGGTHLPDITVVSPLFAEAPAHRLRRRPRAPRRRRRAYAGQHAGDVDDPGRRGRRHPAHPPGAARRGRLGTARAADRADAPARPAPGRPARPACCQPPCCRAGRRAGADSWAGA